MNLFPFSYIKAPFMWLPNKWLSQHLLEEKEYLWMDIPVFMTKCPNISKGSKATRNPGMFVDLFHYILTNLKIIWVTCGLKMTKYLT